MNILQKKIGAKILGLVAIVLFISLIGMVVFYAHSQKETILEQHTANMNNQTNAITLGLKTIMMAGYANIAQAYASVFKNSKTLLEFNIIRLNGAEAFQDNKTILDVNERVGEEEFDPRENEFENQIIPKNDPNLLKVAQSHQKVSFVTDVSGSKILTYLIPILADKECKRCHGSATPVRGILILKSSLDPIMEAIRSTRIRAIWILAISLIGSLIAIYILIKLSVIRPVTFISKAMSLVAKGDLTQTIPIIGKDELSQMAVNFNHMIGEVVKSYASLTGERNKLTTIILSAEEGIITSNDKGEIVLINPAAERLLDKTSQQMEQDGFFNVVDDPDYVRKFLETSGKDMPKTLVYKNKILNFHANSIQNHEGVNLGSAVLIRDVTEEKKLEDKLRAMSFTDKLTGISNRRHMEETLKQEFDRAKRYKLNLSLLFFDVDHFKKFNDTYGHDMGDRVLEEIGRTSRESFRGPDIPCRYGGEEFCMILPNTSSPGAYTAAENFRKRIEDMVVDGVKVTISIGVATYPLVPAKTPEELLKLADVALYEGKRAGRNRVILWQDVVPQDNDKK